MEYYFITGTSRGIGKALAEELLQNEQAFVIGIARHKTLEHSNYRHITADLGNTKNLIELLPEIFQELPAATKLVLVNNAGILGEIGYVGEKKPEDFAFTISVNVTAPIILTNAFIATYAARNVAKTILNISSGAGKNALDGWAGYCTSKAALDMFSETVQKEQSLRNNDVKVYSIAPGIVDTEMQTQIRQADRLEFSQVARFRDYKASGALADSKTVAQKLKKVLEKRPATENVACRLDEII